VQDDVPPSGLSDGGLELLASPLLGPCKLQHLLLPDQREITVSGIVTLTGGRFPGGRSNALLTRLSRRPGALHVEHFSGKMFASTGHDTISLFHSWLNSAFWSCTVLEKLVLDGTGVDDEALLLPAPLAGTLEFVSAVCPPDASGYRAVTEEGVWTAAEAFGKYGGRIEFIFWLV
jgi:hypothetical protein